jgi:hypothetical protein
MLIPVFNKESAAEELLRLCSTLNQAHEHCKDNNFTWRIAQLASQAEELYGEFLYTFKLPDIALNSEHNFPFENIAVNNPNATEVFLSLAFSTVAGMDAAHYENITLSEDFKIKLHELSRSVLSLLHEYRDEAERGSED